MHDYDCRPCGFRADAIGDEESIAVRSCPRCGRRNTGAVLRFFGVALLWCLAPILVSAGMAHQSGWRDDVTIALAFVSLVLVAIVSVARILKWRNVRSRVRFLDANERRSMLKGSPALTPQS